MRNTSTPTDPSAAPAATGASWAHTARETIESIAIAFALAFLFKTFEAEAFVIPTGSMAPTLMGRHKDVVCPECGYRYSASGSEEADRNGNVWRTRDGQIDANRQVVACTCPNCRFYMNVDPLDQSVEPSPSYSGDRIWVSKVPYHLMEPRRWDVIVFRFPEESETYYIKRLIGLPGETVRIYHGDIYTRARGERDFTIQRKSPEKLRAMAQIVHDNDFVSSALVKQGWPQRWQAVSNDTAGGAWQVSDDTRSFATDGSAQGETWVRYFHRVPSQENWRDILDGRWSHGREIPPQLITDFYSFNTRVVRDSYGPTASMLGLHWVGDLLLDCEVDVQSDHGSLLLDLVKGGRHFRATIDVADGRAVLGIKGVDDWHPAASTSIRGPGKHHLMLANVDQQLTLWVDDKIVEFDQPTTYGDLGNDDPQAGSDGGDLAPAGVGSQGATLSVSHLRVLRDIYYIADDRMMSPITDYQGPLGIVPMLRTDDLIEFLSSPKRWTTSAGNVFDARREVRFPLEADQFFVLGDNSPASSDARFWVQGHYVDRDLLVGKALFIYWPHPLAIPIPMTDISIPIIPNVKSMGFIR